MKSRNGLQTTKICNGHFCNGASVSIKDFHMSNGKPKHICKRCRNFLQRTTVDKERSRLRGKLYRINNKEKEITRQLSYNLKNKEKIKDKSKLYSLNNSQKIYDRSQSKIQTKDGYISYLLVQLRSKDKKNNRHNNIVFDYVQQLIEDQNNKCVYSGADLMWKAKSGIHQATIDRIDSNLGHIKGNCQLVTIPVNNFKSNLNDNDFRSLLNMLQNVVDQSPSIYELSDSAKRKVSCMFKDIRKRERHRNDRGFSTKQIITRDCFDAIRSKYNDICSISNIKLTWEPNQINTASIDRIDSAIGYTIENVQVVSRYVNYLKGNLTDDIAKEILTEIKNNENNGI